ncbi:basic proline-rich protein-like [Tyto alba]|uniref:basic proline-rich protein-like n=1 Tax=Tyto alba TaxID=56313 RepID=UPI001C67F25D|nr:basic proline-rich protein-like [Tyto alba]
MAMGGGRAKSPHPHPSRWPQPFSPAEPPDPSRPPRPGAGGMLRAGCPDSPQPLHDTLSPPARFAAEPPTPPAGIFPHTHRPPHPPPPGPLFFTNPGSGPHPARGLHAPPAPPGIQPPRQFPRCCPVALGGGAGGGCRGRGELSPGPATPVRLPGCGRCFFRLCPAPGHRSLPGVPDRPGVPEPPRGTGAAQRYRSLPGVPEPPRGTGAAGAHRVPTHRGASAGAAGAGLGAAALRSSPPCAAASRSPGPPPRGPAGGAACSPPRCRGERGPGLQLGKDPDPSPPPFLPPQSFLQWGMRAHPPLSQQPSLTCPKSLLLRGLCPPPPPPPRAFSSLGVAVSCIPGLHSRASTCTALLLPDPFLPPTLPSLLPGVLLAGCPSPLCR